MRAPFCTAVPPPSPPSQVLPWAQQNSEMPKTWPWARLVALKPRIPAAPAGLVGGIPTQNSRRAAPGGQRRARSVPSIGTCLRADEAPWGAARPQAARTGPDRPPPSTAGGLAAGRFRRLGTAGARFACARGAPLARSARLVPRLVPMGGPQAGAIARGQHRRSLTGHSGGPGRPPSAAGRSAAQRRLGSPSRAAGPGFETWGLK